MIQVQPDTLFGWYGVDASGVQAMFSGIDTTEHYLEVRPQGTTVDIDRVVLMRNTVPDTNDWSAEALIDQWSDTICLGYPASFFVKWGATGCADLLWDFGDGTHSSGTGNSGYAGMDTVLHLYQYPGDYRVVFSVSSMLFDTTAFDTVFVHVGAPDVDAGHDTLVCHGGHVQLEGYVANADTFYWESPLPAALSSTTILNPIATVDSSQYFYLTATDSLGCSMTDSVWVTAVGLDSVSWPDTVWICHGIPDTLPVYGAFYVNWAHIPGLNAYNIAAPMASPTVTTTYYFTASDVCRCDTISDSVVVVVRGIVEQDTTICLGGEATLHATGPGPWTWIPGWSTADSLVVAATVTTTYTLILPPIVGGCNSESVTVTVLPYACCNVPGAQIVHKPTATAWWTQLGLPTSNGTVHIVDTFFVNTNIGFTNMTFYMDSMSVIYVEPGDTLSTVNCRFLPACPNMWSGVHLANASARYDSRRDYFESAWRGVWSKGGAPFGLLETVFRGCWVGVFVGPNPNLGNGNPLHPGRIEGCNFGATTLLPPFSNHAFGWAGVHLDNVMGFTLGIANGQMNNFERLQHGLYAWKSNVNAVRNTFSNMQRGSVPVLPLGTGFGAGIRCINPGAAVQQSYSSTVGHPSATSFQTLDGFANKFVECPVGVRIEGKGVVSVRGNYFNANRTGISSVNQNLDRVWVDYNQHDNDSLAIVVAGGTKINGHVEFNRITGVNAFVGAYHHGIRLGGLTQNLTPAAILPLRVNNNTIKIRGNGIWVEACRRLNVTDNDIELRAMTPQDRMRGIQMSASTNCRIHQNRVTGNAMAAGITRVEGIHVFGSPVTTVTCDTTTSVGYHVTFEMSCPNSVFKGNVMTTGVDGLVYLSWGVIGQQGNLGAASDNRWFGTFAHAHTFSIQSQGINSRLAVGNGPGVIPTINLFTGLGATPMTPILNSTGTFFCAAPFSPAPKADAIAELARSGAPATDLDSASKYRDKEWAFLEILADSSLLLADTSIQHMFDSIDASSLGAAVRAKLQLEAPDSLIAAFEVALVVATDSNIARQKNLLGVRVDDPVIDSVEWSKLMELALQCEDIAGMAVNEARTLLAIEGTYIWEGQECDSVPMIVKKALEISQITKNTKARCWPNPVDKELFVSVLNHEGPVRIDVHGGLGQLLWGFDGEVGNNPVRIDVSKWPSGLLVVRAELTTGEVYIWRVMVVR
jgi:hypothetical protein